jgi:hypothetical protein
MRESPEYTKMCDKAYPILGERKPQAWDYWFAQHDGWEDGVYCISDYETDGGIYGPGIDNPRRWTLLFPVWRQEQLQEMVKASGTWEDLLVEFYGWWSRWSVARQPPLASLEQAWLAFVMLELHGKHWNGEAWVPQTP